MRSAWVIVFAVGCSSKPAPEPRGESARPPPVATLPDAALPVPIDAAPPPVVCLPEDADQLAFDGDAVRACWQREVDPKRTETRCVRIAPDGTVAAIAAPAQPETRFPSATLSEDQRVAEVCVAVGRCKKLAPAFRKDDEHTRIASTAIDARGKYVALLATDNMAGGTVSVYDAATGKLVASGTQAWSDHHAVSYDIAFLGELLLWVEYPGATQGANGELWRIAGNRVRHVARIPGRTRSWAMAGPSTAIVVGDLEIGLWDTARAKSLGEVAIEFKMTEDERNDWIDSGAPFAVVAKPGTFAVLLRGATTQLAFVDVATTTSKLVTVPACP